MNTFLTVDSLNLIQTTKQKENIKKPNQEKRSEKTITASIYDGSAKYPNNYCSQINNSEKTKQECKKESDDEDEEYIEQIQKLLSEVGEIAEERGRKKLLGSILDKDGLPIRGFDINAVIQLGANPYYENSLLEKLVKKTKNQKGCLFSENFSEDSRLQLFGVEQQTTMGENGFKVRTEIFSPKGKHQASCDKYRGGFVYSKYNGRKSRAITKYKEDDSRKIQRTLDYKLTVEYEQNGRIKSARYLTPSDELEGAFREYEYTFNDEEFNNPDKILSKIQSGELKPSSVISDTMQDENGNTTYVQNYQDENYSISRIYTSAKNGSTSHKYTITNKKGDEIFKTSREFQVIDENRAISIIDGKRFDINYDNNARKITVSDGKKQRIIDIEDKISNIKNFYQNILLMPDEDYNGILEHKLYEKDDNINTEDDKAILWRQAKMLPADLLAELDDNVIFWTLDDNHDSYFVEGLLGTAHEAKIGVLAHELGHATESRLKMKCDDEILNTFYNEEINFIENHSGEEATSMIYFFNNECDKGEEIEAGGGIDEVIAEINCILSSQGVETDNISLRSKFLVENFPETIAKIGSKFQNYEEEKTPKLS